MKYVDFEKMTRDVNLWDIVIHVEGKTYSVRPEDVFFRNTGMLSADQMVIAPVIHRTEKIEFDRSERIPNQEGISVGVSTMGESGVYTPYSPLFVTGQD